MSQSYFAHISQKGPIRYGDVPGSIGVLEASDHFVHIGEAHCSTWNENGLAVWTLRIGKQEMPVRWIISIGNSGWRNDAAESAHVAGF